MICLKCGWKRPKASNIEDVAAEPRHDSRRDYPKHSGILFVRNSGESGDTISKSSPQERKAQTFGAVMRMKQMVMKMIVMTIHGTGLQIISPS